MEKKTYQQPSLDRPEIWTTMPVAEIIVDSGKENDEQWSKQRDESFEEYIESNQGTYGNLW